MLPDIYTHLSALHEAQCLSLTERACVSVKVTVLDILYMARFSVCEHCVGNVLLRCTEQPAVRECDGSQVSVSNAEKCIQYVKVLFKL